MPPLEIIGDPTLDAVDRALEARQHIGNPKRNYIGMSGIGFPCARRSWYDYHLETRVSFDAATLKRFDGGHRGEDIMADRLRMVRGITLHTLDPETGKQWRYYDLDNKFSGGMDGGIHGLLQAPNTWHVWEHKQVKESKQAELQKFKVAGEKQALKQWDEVYYGQAVLYMHYSGMDRHYLTCSSPGERMTISVRTNADPAHALFLRNKAERVLNAKAPLARISNDPSWYQCRMCGHHAVCHGE